MARWEKKAQRELTISSVHLPVARPAKKRKISKPAQQPQDPGTQVKQEPNSTFGERESKDVVTAFLKSRPQIVKLEAKSVEERKAAKDARPRAATGEEASDLVHRDHFKGREDAWQQDETIDNFLKRLPVAEPSTSGIGPWLWVSSPTVSRSRQLKQQQSDPDSFIELGMSLKSAFVKQRSKIESENAGKAVATITRKMSPYRDQLEEDLLSAAVKTGTICGKWMLFPASDDLPRYWRVVATATSEGKLGPVSKVAIPDPYDGKDETLICVYTYDFTDLEDVRRVLDELLELSLCRRDGKPIFYKCDAYTYMDITSNNDFKLRASLYSSAELFKDEAKPLKEGPIARLKKRNQTIDSFLTA